MILGHQKSFMHICAHRKKMVCRIHQLTKDEDTRDAVFNELSSGTL